MSKTSAAYEAASRISSSGSRRDAIADRFITWIESKVDQDAASLALTSSGGSGRPDVIIARAEGLYATIDSENVPAGGGLIGVGDPMPYAYFGFGGGTPAPMVQNVEFSLDFTHPTHAMEDWTAPEPVIDWYETSGGQIFLTQPGLYLVHLSVAFDEATVGAIRKIQVSPTVGPTVENFPPPGHNGHVQALCPITDVSTDPYVSASIVTSVTGDDVDWAELEIRKVL